ncbi:hypothetical protein ACH35V_03280 [Actinomadura sp. 1N219]|uniref:hypothetical protein n=1 Tax=Actinomadura sp. 1N219 TaxID=3375152 RepID=UPI0037A4CE85
MAAYLLYLAVPNVGPALRAASAEGTPGVFTAQQLQCIQHPGHESCSWKGEFRSDTGGIHRTGVSLHGAGRDSLQVGAQTKAVDVGRTSRVYSPDGSREWVAIALMVLTSAILLTFACLRMRPRRSTTPAAPEDVLTTRDP